MCKPHRKASGSHCLFVNEEVGPFLYDSCREPGLGWGRLSGVARSSLRLCPDWDLDNKAIEVNKWQPEICPPVPQGGACGGPCLTERGSDGGNIGRVAGNRYFESWVKMTWSQLVQKEIEEGGRLSGSLMS